jgi:hypothetical protein
MSEDEGTNAEVGDKTGHAWVDFFSWGHVAMGIGIYTVTWFIVSLTSAIGISYICFISTFVIGCWLWELFENNLVFSWGLKYADKQDSINNMLGDQFFVTIGAIIMWIVEIIIYGNYETYWLYIIAGIGLIICLIGFFISKAIHDKNSSAPA